MASLPEFVGTVHIFLGPYRGNPIALYLQRDEATCEIAPRIYPWNRTIGSGETPNKAAAAFEAKWKENELSAEMYSGPHWEGGIKPEKPKPPPKPAAPKPTAAPATTDAAKPSAPAGTSTEGSAQPAVAQPTKGHEQAAPETKTATLTPTPPQTSASPAAPAVEKSPEPTQPPSSETT